MQEKIDPSLVRTQAFTDRFWSKVRKTEGCWIWTGNLKPGKWKYGKVYVRVNGRDTMMIAHRVAWIIEHGNISEGLCVLHRCDNPQCVRPSHLFLGTEKQNTQDAVSKGRMAHGESHGRSRLTFSKVLEARNLFFSKRKSVTQLAKEHGVGLTTMSEAIRSVTWTK